MAKLHWKLFGAILSVLVFSNLSLAAEDDDEFFHEILRAPAEYSLKLSYDGARDEQPLEVQAVLPQPNRSPEGLPDVYSVTGEEAPSYD